MPPTQLHADTESANHSAPDRSSLFVDKIDAANRALERLDVLSDHLLNVVEDLGTASNNKLAATAYFIREEVAAARAEQNRLDG